MTMALPEIWSADRGASRFAGSVSILGPSTIRISDARIDVPPLMVMRNGSFGNEISAPEERLNNLIPIKLPLEIDQEASRTRFESENDAGVMDALTLPGDAKISSPA